MSGFRERLTYDPASGEYRDGAIRYMMIRPDSLMGMLQELPDAMRPQVLAALARSVARHGGHSAATYHAAGADLLASITSTAPALGWGTWSLTETNAGLHLTVENSPFAAGTGISAVPVCAPIVGMLSAVASLLRAHDVCASETTCAAVTGGRLCCFIV